MARPRIFISSTYYDLKYIRNDLERFVKELGYDPILSERGHIPYGKDEALEQYCYREINNCDILVNIVGGNYGSPSQQDPYSVSQLELKTAYDLHKQIYIFVERTVHVEYKTYLKNEGNKSFVPQYVNDIKVYKFLKEIYDFPSNNTIVEFDSVNDIISYLKEQWAGLFQRFLQDESRKLDYKISSNLKATAETLSKVVEYTTRERDETMKHIILSYHPIFNQLAEEAKIPIRIIFTNWEELDKLLTTFGYTQVETPEQESSCKNIVYERKESNVITKLTISKDVFDERGNLVPVEQGQWDLAFVEAATEETEFEFNLDDLPF